MLRTTEEGRAMNKSTTRVFKRIIELRELGERPRG
jgi:hypothetical protein